MVPTKTNTQNNTKTRRIPRRNKNFEKKIMFGFSVIALALTIIHIVNKLLLFYGQHDLIISEHSKQSLLT